MGLLRSFLVVQSRKRTLYLYQTPSARTAGVSSPHGFPTRTLEMSTHARSLTLRSSTEVIFGHETLSFMTENGRIGSLRRKSSPHVTELVEN